MLTCSADGRWAAFAGFDGDVGPRIYLLEVEEGTLRAVGPVGTSGPVIAPDGERVAGLSPDGVVTVYPVADDDRPYVVPGIAPGERPLQWSRDGRSLLVWNRVFPARIQRVDVADGRRTEALEIMPSDPAGVLYGQIILAPGGDHYVYRYRRDLSTLFLVEGVL
jgi:hypothetical protein